MVGRTDGLDRGVDDRTEGPVNGFEWIYEYRNRWMDE